MVTNVNPAASTASGITSAANVLSDISNRLNPATTGSSTNVGTSTASSGGKAGAALEATMKQQVSTLVGDGKNGQYATQRETAQAVTDKYKSLKGEARAKFVEDMAAIGKPLGLDFGLKDKAGKPLNQGVELAGDAKEAAARLWREFAGIPEPTAKTSAAQPAATPPIATPAVTAPADTTTKATTRDEVDTSESTRRENVTRGVAAMDTSGDGKVSELELMVFAVKQRTPSTDAAYAGLLEQTKTFAKNRAVMPQAEVVDFLLRPENKGTMFVNEDVAKARG